MSDSESKESSKKRKKSEDKEEKASEAAKKSKEDADNKKEESEEEEEWIGPLPSEAAPAKREKVLEFESLYLKNLPDANGYERSYMHRDVVIFSAVAATDFLVTASVDGHVKFWKKHPVGIEFVKHFRAHLGNIQDVSLNHNGTLLCTVSNDKNAKVFDVANFDMINILKLGKYAIRREKHDIFFLFCFRS